MYGYSTTMTTHTKARRSHSMPSRYVMPRPEVGEYEGSSDPMRRRSAPARPSSGMLFPLSEEGTYGAPPAAPYKPPPYQPRERKPKVYSSYGVDANCNVHSKKIAKEQVGHSHL